MMFFGITTFAGLVTSVVTVTGLAVGSAVALAEPTVFYKGAGLSVAESQAQGNSLRTAITGGAAQSQADAWGQAKVEFLLQGSALSEAIASGYSRVDFSGYGTVMGEALWRGKAYKRTRVRPGIAASGEAIGYGDAVSYVYAAGSPAIGFAKAIGTTWHVVRAAVVGEALATGDAIRILGAKQRAEGESFATATAFYQVGFSGVELSEAYAMGDASVRINNVLHHAGNGTAIAEGYASLSHVSVYQPQRAESEAIAQGQPQHTHGAKGRGTGESLARGYGVVGQTSVGYVLGLADSVALGLPTKLAHAAGLAVGSSDSRADAHAQYAQKASGTVEGLALIRGNPVALYRARGTADGTATAVTAAALRSAFVDAVVIRGESLAKGNGIRTVFVTPVRVEGAATATGYNQINDLVHAPVDRTLIVESQGRVLVVETEPRLILV